MIGESSHTLTKNLEQFLIVLTSTSIVAISGLMVFTLAYKSGSRLFWGLVYGVTALNVVIWSLVALC